MSKPFGEVSEIADLKDIKANYCNGTHICFTSYMKSSLPDEEIISKLYKQTLALKDDGIYTGEFDRIDFYIDGRKYTRTYNE